MHHDIDVLSRSDEQQALVLYLPDDAWTMSTNFTWWFLGRSAVSKACCQYSVNSQLKAWRFSSWWWTRSLVPVRTTGVLRSQQGQALLPVFVYPLVLGQRPRWFGDRHHRRWTSEVYIMLRSMG